MKKMSKTEVTVNLIESIVHDGEAIEVELEGTVQISNHTPEKFNVRERFKIPEYQSDLDYAFKHHYERAYNSALELVKRKSVLHNNHFWN